MSVINTNITSLIGQHNLSKSQSALQSSMERLSSGLRINSAKDDAAGQAIANRMSAQITGLAQAQRNASDGISLSQTAEGALGQINDNVQRIRELTVQSLNDTNSVEDRQSIQDEIGQRLEEITRITKETEFNGVHVLGGAEGKDIDVNIQVGARDGQQINIKYDAINLESLGLNDFNVASPAAATVSDVLASAEADATVSLDVDGTTVEFTLQADGTWEGDDGDDTDPDPANHTDPTTYTAAELTSAVAESDADVTFDLDGTQYVISSEDGSVTTGSEAVYVVEDALTVEADFPEGVTEATPDPLAVLDNALNNIDGLRSNLGAIQNRFEDAINNLRTNETNLSAARSRIEDADYAVEVANMTRAQILQQAGTSVLAQANQIPQIALSLLG